MQSFTEGSVLVCRVLLKVLLRGDTYSVYTEICYLLDPYNYRYFYEHSY